MPKVRMIVTGELVLSTGLHLGSGKRGESAVDMGVARDPVGDPFIPGSSLKGVFRATAESLAGYFGMTACMLDRTGNYACANQDMTRKALSTIREQPYRALDIAEQGTCDVCRVFGSPLISGKTRFDDSFVRQWAGRVEYRDGVGLDRDSGTAVDGVKFDLEVVPAGAEFGFRMCCESLTPRENALVVAVLLEWQRGFRLGGMTSRGLGATELRNLSVTAVDLEDPEERVNYLVEGTMKMINHDVLTESVRRVLQEAQNA
jgi:CRISPR-associated protein Csm3